MASSEPKEEFKINEPTPKKKTDNMADKVKTVKAIDFALRMTLISLKDNLDADNVFQVMKGKNTPPICILSDILPCRNAHCMGCNMVLMHEKEAKRFLNYIGMDFTKKIEKMNDEELSDEGKKMADEMRDFLKKEIIGDDTDE